MLLSAADREAAAHDNAAEPNQYFSALCRRVDWLRQLYYEPRPVAAARRARAFARLAEDPRRAVDIAGLEPESPSEDAACQKESVWAGAMRAVQLLTDGPATGTK
jgi:menaquinone-9 beta-reductase